jgi:ParB-like chromosome segregation protein Spo0J
MNSNTFSMKKVAPKLPKELNDELNKLQTISSKMRLLDKKGYTRGDIARILNKSYQHVKNVLDRPLKQQQ